MSIIPNLRQHFNKIKKKPEYTGLRGVLLFIVITILIHFSFRFWAHTLHYFPISDFFYWITNLMEDMVFKHSNWVITHILRVKTVLNDHTIYLNDNWGIIISEGCTGLKQFIQVFLLFLIYPGPWKHKLWFIPAGMILMHLTNILRISLLAEAMKWNLPHIHFIHNYPLRFLFYIGIFALWWLWAEKISKKKPDEKSSGLKV
jgi:exosortase/archaeosortase family protein